MDSICFFGRNKSNNSDILYCFYDLQVSAASFDIVHFLIMADTERKNRNVKSLCIIFVPGMNEGFSDSFVNWFKKYSQTDFNIDLLKWRVRQILIPCCYLFPHCSEIIMCESRDKAYQIFSQIKIEKVFPKYYSVSSPVSIYNYEKPFSKKYCSSSIVPSISALNYIDQWIISRNLSKKKIVTITLRESSYEIDRNSNLLEWMKFIDYLEKESYIPIVVRDTETAFDPIPEPLMKCNIFSDVCWNIEMRAALYQKSYINLFVPNGPASLTYFNSNSCAIFFKIITDTSPITTKEHLENIGIPLGSQCEFFSKYQKLVWEDDIFDVITREFEEMAKLIELEKNDDHIVSGEI
jgi:hypothetical protein